MWTMFNSIFRITIYSCALSTTDFLYLCLWWYSFITFSELPLLVFPFLVKVLDSTRLSLLLSLDIITCLKYNLLIIDNESIYFQSFLLEKSSILLTSDTSLLVTLHLELPSSFLMNFQVFYLEFLNSIQNSHILFQFCLFPS